MMYKIALSLAIVLAPAALAAQASARAESRTNAQAQAKIGRSDTQVQSSAAVEAEVKIARERGLPTEPIRRRAAEGHAKGASETQVAASAARVRANLEAAHEAMVRAGREHPSDQEVERGASIMERGYTQAQ